MPCSTSSSDDRTCSMPTPLATGRAAYWVEPVASTTRWPAWRWCSIATRAAGATSGATWSRYQISHLAIISASESPRRSSTSLVNTASMSSSARSEEHTSELQSRGHLVCRLLLEKKKKKKNQVIIKKKKKKKKH